MAKVIHTGLYSNTAKQILSYMLLNLKNRRCSWSTSDQAVGHKYKIDIDINGELLLSENSSNDYNNRWRFHRSAIGRRNDIDARKWISWQIKRLVYDLYGKDQWKRNNEKVLPCYSKEMTSYRLYDAQLEFTEQPITVKMIYCLYDILNTRSRSVKRYGAEFIDSIVGVERDPFLTEQEKIRRDENAQIKKEADLEIDRLYHEYYEKIEAFKKKMTVEREAAQQAVRDKCEADLKELNEAFALSTQMVTA